ncbi:hypothetical protein M409DRAFT_26127 [Zasmidium cellare ATCC 36951]|uniref:Uncharacterized protein n=1 Tax=Zasmidium cellare ATCC 36951 TaxID=1080233 RepID=A0A6A6C905_ZASCE|nr:uncharacterized protein M409DRAFT_26127 [Zasmidium cellare ATCC 36951]KAF2163515.1 hypothetical protein M409DRAFT_26127 [Zasmidium cellare ATCC 36951]
MEKSESGLFAFCLLFLAVALFCYCWEISTRTPWDAVRRTLRSAVSQRNREQANTSPAEKSSDPDLEAVNGTQNQENNHSPPRHSIARAVTWIPAVLWPFSLIPALLSYKPSGIHHSLNTNSSEVWNSTTLELDPDIGGTGIRVGIYIPVGLALLTLLAGLLHNDDSGAKEIGNAQLLTLFYLNFNAVKAAWPRFEELTFPEVMVACMSIDLTAAGLQMTTSGKESLASRWFVFASALNQLVAASIVCAMLARIRHNYSFSSGHCAYINWWGRVDSCNGPSKSTWAYLAARWCILLHGLWLDWRYAQEFHIIENDWRSLASGDQETEKSKGDFDDETDYLYGRLRATVFSKWAELLPSILVAMTGIETLVRRIPLDSNITDWGSERCVVVYELMDDDYRKLRPVDYPRYTNAWLPRKGLWNQKLIEAARTGDIKAVREALRGKRADVDHVEDGMTALLYAVSLDNVDLVIELMSPKHDAKVAVETTAPAVSFAAEHGRLNVLKHFIPMPPVQQEGSTRLRSVKRTLERNLTMAFRPDTGGDNQYSRQPDANGRSPLWLAAVNGHNDAVEHILRVWDQSTIAQELSKHDHITQRTLPFEVAEREDTEILKDLLLKRCPTAALQDTLKTAVEQESVKALSTLIKCDLGTFAVNEEGYTILHLMARSNQRNSPLFDLIIQAGQSVDIGDSKGRTPLHIATLSNARFVALDLCRSGANPHVKDTFGKTPFLSAVESKADFFVDHFCKQDKFHEDLFSALQEIPGPIPVEICEMLWSTTMYRKMPLFLHALNRLNDSLFIALIKSSKRWHQRSLRRNRIHGNDDWFGASSISAKLGTIFELMSMEDRRACEQRIRKGGGGRYLDDPPRDYKCNFDELTTSKAFTGNLHVLNTDEGGIEIEDETEARLDFESHLGPRPSVTTYHVAIWPGRRVSPGEARFRVYYVLKELPDPTFTSFSVIVDNKRVGLGIRSYEDDDIWRQFFREGASNEDLY